MWTGLLAGPLVWLVLLEANYVLSYVACETRQRWFMHAATLLAIALVAAAGLWSWRASVGHPLEPEELSAPLSDTTAVQRVRWMALAGAVVSAAFILLMIATHIPVLILKTCQ